MEVRYGTYDDAEHYGRGTSEAIFGLIQRLQPDVFGLQEVAFQQQKRKTTGYVGDGSFHDLLVCKSNRTIRRQWPMLRWWRQRGDGWVGVWVGGWGPEASAPMRSIT